MKNLLSASQVIKKLNDENIVGWGKARFSQLAKEKIFITHRNPPSPKDFYIFEEVVEAIRANEDPRREAQREASARKREDKGVFEFERETPMTREEFSDFFHTSPAPAEVPKISTKNDETFDDEKNKKDLVEEGLRYDNRIKKVKAEEAEGNVISREEITKSLFNIVRILRDGLVNVPARLSPTLSTVTDTHETKVILEKEINRLLVEFERSINEL